MIMCRTVKGRRERGETETGERKKIRKGEQECNSELSWKTVPLSQPTGRATVSPLEDLSREEMMLPTVPCNSNPIFIFHIDAKLTCTVKFTTTFSKVF